MVGADNLNVSQDVVYIEAGIYHGGELLGDTLVTSEHSKTLHPRWNQWLVFDVSVKNLPKAARLCLKVNNDKMCSCMCECDDLCTPLLPRLLLGTDQLKQSVPRVSGD